MSRQGSIVVVGSVNADLITTVARHPLPGETLHGTGGHVLPGGKGANQAVAAARLGGQVTMVGAVGDDANAQPALSGLRASGADLTRVRTVPGPTGLAVITVDEAGENTIIVVAGANGEVSVADDVEPAADLLEAAAVVVSQCEVPRAVVDALPGHVRGRFILNPSPVMELNRQTLLAADPLVVNEHEAELVLQLLGGGSDGSPTGAVRALLGAGVRSVVLTLGAAGSLVAEGARGARGAGAADGSVRTGAASSLGSGAVDAPVTAVEAVRVQAVDTTGAGDAFTGALAVRLAAGDDLVAAARYATRVSAFAVQGHGAQPSYPSSEDALPGGDGEVE